MVQPVRFCHPTRAEMAGDPCGNGTPVLLLFFCLLSERRYMGSTASPETDDWALDQLRLPPELVGDLTPKRRPPRHRPGDPFIKGPIPYSWIALACRLPGSGLHVAMACRFLCGRYRRPNRWGLEPPSSPSRAAPRARQGALPTGLRVAVHHLGPLLLRRKRRGTGARGTPGPVLGQRRLTPPVSNWTLTVQTQVLVGT